MKPSNERGVAVILALILVLVLSVLAVSMMFLSRTETWSSMNYRSMTQTRYGAEAGLQAAANYLMYPSPGIHATDTQYTNYDKTVSPVKWNGKAVVLSADSNVASNYPDAAIQTAFNSAGKGSLKAGNNTINYTSYATLLGIKKFTGIGGGAYSQIWQITADGTISGARPAQVEITEVLEQQMVKVFSYAAFATGNTCGALSFGGGGISNSYNSANKAAGTQNSQGNVGSNGNLNENGAQTTIYGTMSTPMTGVGNCANGAVDAWTDKGNATVTGGLIQLSQAITYPTPPAPNPMPPTTTQTLNHDSDCTSIPGCSGTGTYTLAPGQYGNLTLKSNVHLTAGTYNINSLTLNGNPSLTIDSGPVILNIAGVGQATPVDLTGGSLVNSSWVAANFEIVYGGSGTIKMNGGTDASGIVYAPNAAVTMNGGANWYGAAIGLTVSDTGGTAFHYDTQLANNAQTYGNYMLDSFSWKKF